MDRGLLISFEGIDGCGKSTQAALFADRLRDAGRTVHLVREPGGTPLGERVRALVLTMDGVPIAPRAELFLYLSARAQVCADIISPCLLRGEDVVMDRFIDSTTAYQGHARGIGIDEVERLNVSATGGLVPDATVFIDCDPAIAALRLTGAPDRLEAEGQAFMRRVRDGFVRVSQMHAGRVVRIDGGGSVTAIAAAVAAAVGGMLKGVSGLLDDGRVG